jgi:hypothetical protein
MPDIMINLTLAIDLCNLQKEVVNLFKWFQVIFKFKHTVETTTEAETCHYVRSAFKF